MAKRVNVEAHPSQLALTKVDSNVLLELFPFAIILDHDMRISKCGEKLLETWMIQHPYRKPATFFQSSVTTHLKLRRPKGIEFNWKTVVLMHTVIFELELIRGEDPHVRELGLDESLADIASNMAALKTDDIGGATADGGGGGGCAAAGGEEGAIGGVTKPDANAQNSSAYRLLLKGQMRYIADIDAIVFLCSPV